VAKKERSAKGKPTFFGTTGAAKKGRFTATEDGEIRMRRKKGLEMEVVGGKRKRVDVCEESNKRVAAEGRSFAVMRARREATVSSAMEIDSSDAPPAAALLFSL
jgi:hypothetical protein